MNNQLMMLLAVRLCCADVSCGFIPIAPVLGNREALIQQRFFWHQEWLNRLGRNMLQGTSTPDIFPHLITQAVELTCADIISDAIAVAPVLYDRDTKITESVTTYFSWLQVFAADYVEESEPTVGEEDIHSR